MDGTPQLGVAHAGELLAFADAVVSFDTHRIAAAREAVVACMDEAAMIDAAAVIAGFNGITRIADATGIPLEDAKAADTASWRVALGLDRLPANKF
jgi:hypothetical protein